MKCIALDAFMSTAVNSFSTQLRAGGVIVSVAVVGIEAVAQEVVAVEVVGTEVVVVEGVGVEVAVVVEVVGLEEVLVCFSPLRPAAASSSLTMNRLGLKKARHGRTFCIPIAVATQPHHRGDAAISPVLEADPGDSLFMSLPAALAC
ncbi:unnamed protein product [Arctogadus glacialis]